MRDAYDNVQNRLQYLQERAEVISQTSGKGWQGPVCGHEGFGSGDSTIDPTAALLWPGRV